MATIAYCAVLNRRLGALRRGERELRGVLAGFADAAARAETSVARLKQTGEAMADSLRDRIEEARAVYDDLSFIVDRSDDLASRLAAAPPAARQTPSAPRGGALGHDAGAGLSRAERELLEALDAGRTEAGR